MAHTIHVSTPSVTHARQDPAVIHGDTYHGDMVGSAVGVHDSIVTVSNVHNDHTSKPATVFDLLNPHIARDALYNSRKREEEQASICQPGTRTEILQIIREWVDGAGHAVCWLHGPAGTGKSTIAHTIAEEYSNKGLAATFFFARKRGDREDIDKLIPTLAYQIAQNIPSTQPMIREALEKDEMILRKPLHDQFLTLVIGPTANAKRPLVVLDGLDECASRNSILTLIRLLGETIKTTRHPIRFLLTSRPEPDIEVAFRSHITSTALWLSLEDSKEPMRKYLRENLLKVRERFSSVMQNEPKLWPGESILDDFAEKSEGLFIHATTAVQYIGDGKGLPQEKLLRVLKMHKGLDSLYTQVITDAQKFKHFDTVIGSLMYLREPLSISELSHLLGLDVGEIRMALHGCHSILNIPENNNGIVRPYHASLRDFLTSQERSKDLFCAPGRLNNLELSLQIQYDRTAEMQNLDEAIVYQQRVVEAGNKLDGLELLESQSGTDALVMNRQHLVKLMGECVKQPDGQLGNKIVHTLRALIWIIDKYQLVHAILPEKVAIFTKKLVEILEPTQPVTSQHHASHDISIAAVFLIGDTDDMALDIGGLASSPLGILLKDFNKRQAFVPLELCRSWSDLCDFLTILLRGEKGNSFIANGMFALKVPDQEDLLRREGWDSWISHINQGIGAPPHSVTLYAVIIDDSGKCPNPECEESIAVKIPMPSHSQQCWSCKFEFLELYQEETADIQGPYKTSENVTRSESSEDPASNVVDAENSKPSPLAQTVVPEPLDAVGVNPVPVPAPVLPTSSSPPDVPQHIQVVRRRRKPILHEEPDQTPLQFPPMPRFHQDITPSILHNPLGMLHTTYMYSVFCLPYHYRSLDKGWRVFRKRSMDEWFQAETAAGILFTVLFTVLQISSAANDPISRTIVQLSIVCLFFGGIYSELLRITFRNLEEEALPDLWERVCYSLLWSASGPNKDSADQELTSLQWDTFWNVWIMLSMPLVWTLWGVIYFACFLVVFLWQSNKSDENSRLTPNQVYGPRAITTLIFVVGLAYLVLIYVKVRRIT